jgi:hypothetical protein
MDLLKMIADLQTEKERLDEAILALERLSTANTRRRGRPSRGPKDGRHATGGMQREQAEEEENEPSVKDG